MLRGAGKQQLVYLRAEVEMGVVAKGRMPI